MEKSSGKFHLLFTLTSSLYLKKQTFVIIILKSHYKTNKHTVSGYLLFTHCSFDRAKSKLGYYGGKDCMKNLCKNLKEHTIKIISYEKKEMISLATEEINHIMSKNICYTCKKAFSNDNKNYHKVRHHYHQSAKYIGAAHDVCNLRYIALKEIPVLFPNGSRYAYYFIIKELVEEFKGQFEYLGENTEKYITFSVPIKKEIDIG